MYSSWLRILCAALTIPGAAEAATFPTSPKAQPCGTHLRSPLFIPLAGDSLRDVAFDDGCTRIFVANTALNKIDVISLASGRPEASIPVGSQPTNIDMGPDGKLYVANTGGGSLSVIDTATLTEVSRIDLRLDDRQANPQSLAVAKNGLILFTTAGPFISRPDVAQYDPVTGLASWREDWNVVAPPNISYWYPDRVRLVRTPDRSIIAAVGFSYYGGITRYIVGQNKFVYAHEFYGDVLTDLAFSPSGNVGLTNGWVLDSSAKPLAPAPRDHNIGFAISPDGRTGYQANEGDSVWIIDMATGAHNGGLLSGDPAVQRTRDVYATAGSSIDISSDGTLLAMLTSNGVSIIRTAGPKAGAPYLQVLAYSDGYPGGYKSALQFHNTGANAASAHVTLADPATGAALVEWDSPPIAAGTSQDFSIDAIAATAAKPFNAPWQYMASVSSQMNGTMSHLVWNVLSESLATQTTCGADLAAPGKTVPHVRASALGGPASILAVTNLEPEVVFVDAELRSAVTGQSLATIEKIRIFPKRTVNISAESLERAAADYGFQASSETPRYIVEFKTPKRIYAQHLLRNPHSGVLTDITAACVIPGTVVGAQK